MPGLPPPLTWMTGAFQSAPGLEAGRCDKLRLLGADFCRFQSAPGLEAGRCMKPLGDTLDVYAFQSAPGLEAGRCAHRVARLIQCGHVSIRARP